jgi:hypothetical protein
MNQQELRSKIAEFITEPPYDRIDKIIDMLERDYTLLPKGERQTDGSKMTLRAYQNLINEEIDAIEESNLDNITKVHVISVLTQSIALNYKGERLYTEEEIIEMSMGFIAQFKFGNTNIFSREMIKESLRSSQPKKD